MADIIGNLSGATELTAVITSENSISGVLFPPTAETIPVPVTVDGYTVTELTVEVITVTFETVAETTVAA